MSGGRLAPDTAVARPAPRSVPAAPVSRVRFAAYELVQTLTVFIAVSASVLVL